jgi:hypothetical protein
LRFAGPFRKGVAGEKVEVVSHSLLRTRAYSKGSAESRFP